MKYFRIFCSLLLLASLAALTACSDSGSSDSGSSNEPDLTTSTNTEPPENNTTDDGASSGPSDDQPTTAGNTDAASGGDGDTDVNGSNGGTDSDSSSDAGSGSDSAGGGDTTSGSGNTDTSGGDTGETHTDDADPVINPDSSLGQLQSRIKFLTGRTLIALNQSLSQGEMLSAQQEQCLGTYDPAIGEPLLSIDCDQPLATGEVPIFASVASLQDTPECRASLQNANADDCAIDQAQLSAKPIFTVPETGRPQLKQAGATLSYNIMQDRLTLENLDPPLSGTFFCEYDLTNGNAVGGDPGGNCYVFHRRVEC